MRKRKQCPRCAYKCDNETLICPSCRLNFSKLELATNKAAKKMIFSGQKNKVVYIKGLPKDVKFSKLLLISIFLGLFGGHCFMVGRISRGIFMLIGGIFALVGSVLGSFKILAPFEYTLIILVGIVGFVWLVDIFNICFYKFKVPVYIDLEVK